MSGWWLTALAASGIALALGGCLFVLLWRPIRGRLREHELARARRDFHRQREHLEAQFVRLAAESGKPRGLEWVRCDFDDDVTYARHRRNGELSAFVAVTIGFEAVEGGGMENVEAVGNLRAATAVFHVKKGHWATEGRALFNLNPAEAIAYYQDNLELVGQEVAHPT